MAQSSPVGFLVPLNSDLSVDGAAEQVPILPGTNSFGRNNLGVVDRRVSRHHIILHASEGGAAELAVEAKSSEILVDSSFATIRHSRISDERSPAAFRLLQVKGIPSWANSSAVGLQDVVQGNVIFAVLSNYMVDIDWLLSECPFLEIIPRVLVIHGESGASLDIMKMKKPSNWVLHRPPLPISYGTHHSKAMLLVYPHGLRVIIHTANLIYVDWNNKTQALWMQDFPLKNDSAGKGGCPFENDLVDYLNSLKWPELNVSYESIGQARINPSFFRRFDFSCAMVRLVASVPGYHTGSNLKKWGHMKLRSTLENFTFDDDFKGSSLVYQFSSLGSLDEKWLSEFASSLSSGVSNDKSPLGPGKAQIIWPTVEDVRCSLEGYAAGSAIPSPMRNVEKEFLKKYWVRWKATQTGRCRAMPHIKSYTRYSGQRLAWFLLTSANLSKAAWGALQKNNSQLFIRSYELGVLFLPMPLQGSHLPASFSCTDDNGFEQASPNPKGTLVGMRHTCLVTLSGQKTAEETDSSDHVITLPVPYELPPRPYTSEDVPWSWERQYTKKDVHGQVWPCKVQLYMERDP
ncbi:tyrosyl-DNA phosphodiesterase-like protein isoform X2 [Wolffia australiana]